MACKQVIVLPPKIPMVCPSPTDIRDFLHDMVPAMREVIAATLSTEFEDDIIYILQSFIQLILAQWSWKKYYRKLHKKEKEPFPTWFLNWLRKYLSDNRATLAKTLPSNSFKRGTSRPVLKLSRTKLIVIYLRPRDVSPIGCIRL
jgi:hypothetical protein